MEIHCPRGVYSKYAIFISSLYSEYINASWHVQKSLNLMLTQQTFDACLFQLQYCLPTDNQYMDIFSDVPIRNFTLTYCLGISRYSRLVGLDCILFVPRLSLRTVRLRLF